MIPPHLEALLDEISAASGVIELQVEALAYAEGELLQCIGIRGIACAGVRRVVSLMDRDVVVVGGHSGEDNRSIWPLRRVSISYTLVFEAHLVFPLSD